MGPALTQPGIRRPGMRSRLHYSQMMSTKRPARRPGGRTAAVSSAIKTAVEELVAEKGRDRVSIPMVAERAGVNPTTVYRRWPDAATMINDIATYRLDPTRPMPDTGDLQRDIGHWATEILRHYRKPITHPPLRGAAPAEEVVDRVLAPIMYRVIFLPWTLTDDYAQSLTDKLFDGR